MQRVEPKGEVRDRTEDRAAMARRMLFSPGVEVSEDFPDNVPAFANASEELIVNPALACERETNIAIRLRRCDPRPD